MPTYTHTLAVLREPRMLLATAPGPELDELLVALNGVIRRQDTVDAYRVRFTDEIPHVAELVWDSEAPNGFPLPKRYAVGEQIGVVSFEDVAKANAGKP